MAAPGSKSTRNIVLISMHLALACFLLMLSFLLHGNVPGLTADESAGLGFLLMFGLGPPILAIAVGTCAISVFVGGRHLGILAASMLVTVVFAAFNVWTGVAASLGYIVFAALTLAKELQRTVQPRESI